MNLDGQLVLIVASMPEDRAEPGGELPRERGRMTSEWMETEEAIVSVVRAIVGNGGREAFVGDATSALLAATVAGEYVHPQEAEGEERRTPPLFVARGGRRDDPDFDLSHRLGMAELDQHERTSEEAVAASAQRADAMVCIGSTSVEREMRLFRDRNEEAPIFVFAESGGASRTMLDRQLPSGVRFVDRDAREFLPRRRDDTPPDETPEHLREFEYPPFAFAAQMVADYLWHRRGPR